QRSCTPARPRTARASTFAFTACDQSPRLGEKLAMQAEQRLTEADATWIVVVNAQPWTLVGSYLQAAAGRIQLLACVDRNADIVAVAHEQQLGDLPECIRQADYTVTPIVSGVWQGCHRGDRNRQPIRGCVHLVFRKIQLARPHVLVRIELDLLETNDARHDVDFAVRSWKVSRMVTRVENGHTRVSDRVGVVVAVHFAHERLPAFEV